MALQLSLPRRRKVAKSGIREIRREFPRHRRFVRSHECSVPNCQDAPIEFAHVRSAANAGTSLRPHDAFAISLCASHHREQHNIGQPAFERKYNIDMMTLAMEFTERSPDVAMRESLRDGL